MRINENRWNVVFKSIFGLTCAFLILIAMQWLLMMLGAFLSGFPGNLKLINLKVVSYSDTYLLKHVLWLYLFPYMGFVVLFLMFSFNKQYLSKSLFKNSVLFQWFYTLLIITVFFIPLCEIINKKGIYYALSWLYIGRAGQYLIGMILFVLYLIITFRISMVFSTNINLAKTHKKLDKLFQIIYLWYFPVVILTGIVVLVSPHFEIKNACLLLGITFTILINTPLIISYKVIIK